MSSRWTVLGLGLPGSAWLRRVTEWSVSGALRLEFIKCVSVDEAIGRLAAAANPPSAALVDAALVDVVLVDVVLAARHIELIEAAHARSAQVIVVGASGSSASNEALQSLSGQGLSGQGSPGQGLPGVAYLADDFDHRQLAELLQAGPNDFGADAPAAQHSNRASYLNGANAASNTNSASGTNGTSNTNGISNTSGTSNGSTNTEDRLSNTEGHLPNTEDHLLNTEGHLPNIEGHLPNTEGHLIAVMGRPGSGVSTTAIALAQGFSDHLREGSVLLADFSRYGDQALLHDSPDVVPGIQELVAEQANPMHANTAQADPMHASTAQTNPVQTNPGVRHLTYVIADRGYDLLLGLRRRRDWTSLRAAPFEAAVTAMRSEYQAVVADLDDDLEGKAETGSSDVQARNMATRHVALVADAVLVVGTTSLVGARSILQLIDDLHSLGVEPHKIRPLAIQLRQRSSQRQTQRSLSQMLTQNANLAAAGHIAEHRYVDDAHRNGTRMPSQLVTPALAAVEDLLGTMQLSGGQLGGDL